VPYSPQANPVCIYWSVAAASKFCGKSFVFTVQLP